MTNQKKQDENKGSINPVVAAVTGAVVGAGIAVAGAVALKDEKSRNKVRNVLTNVKDQAVDNMEGMQNQAKDKTDEAGKMLAKGKNDVEKKSLKV